MTLKDLERLRSLNKEIEYERGVLHSLKKTGDYVCVFRAGPVRISDHCDEIEALEQQIKEHLDECMALYREILDFISSIDDPLIRLIISLKCVNGLEWEQIALHIGGKNTAESVRKVYERFMKKKFSGR